MAEEEEKGLAGYTFSMQQQGCLNNGQQSTMRKAFHNYDANKDGTMDRKEFKNALIDQGYRQITDEEVHATLHENDKDGDGVINWNEFVEMMIKKEGTSGIKLTDVQEQEVATYTNVMKVLLANDEHCPGQVANLSSDRGASMFESCSNGVMLAKLCLCIDKDCMDARTLYTKSDASIWEQKANVNLALSTVKGLGVKVIGIDATDIMDKEVKGTCAVIWQVLRKAVTAHMSLQDTPEIFKLLEEGEDPSVLTKLKTEQILIRWVNYHLAAAGQERRINNLGKDLKDSKVLFYVLNQLDKGLCPLDGIDTECESERAGKMIANSRALGVPELVRPRDIISGNDKINTLFVSYIFNTKHGLIMSEEEYAAAGMIDDDIEGAKEERVYRMWINSLDLDGVYVNSLYDECRDGILLCKVIHKIDDSVVDWKKVVIEYKNKFQEIGNCNEAIKACKAMKIKVIGVDGKDINDGHAKSLSAIVWQLVRAHYLKLIGGKTEENLVEWANQQVAGKSGPIKDFKDKQLADSQYFIHLCGSIEPRVINWDLVLKDGSEEAMQNNAKYAISCCRTLKAVIFCVWEDLVKVNPKQNLVIIATLSDIAANYKA